MFKTLLLLLPFKTVVSGLTTSGYLSLLTLPKLNFLEVTCSDKSVFPYYCKQQARLWFPGLNFRFTKVFFFFLHATAVNVSVSLAAVQDNQSKNKRTKTNCMKRKLHDTKGHYNSDHIYM